MLDYKSNPQGRRPTHDGSRRPLVDTGVGRGGGDGLDGVALVDPHVGDGQGDPFCLAQQLGECGPGLGR